MDACRWFVIESPFARLVDSTFANRVATSAARAEPRRAEPRNSLLLSHESSPQAIGSTSHGWCCSRLRR